MAEPTERIVRKSPPPAAERFEFRVTSFDSTSLCMTITRDRLPKVRTPGSRKRPMADGEVPQTTPCPKRAKTVVLTVWARLEPLVDAWFRRFSRRQHGQSFGCHLLGSPTESYTCWTRRRDIGWWMSTYKLFRLYSRKRQFPEINGLQVPCLHGLGLVGQLERFPVQG